MENNNHRSKAFLISLTLMVVVLEQGTMESLGVPVPSSPPCTNSSAADNLTTTATELQEDEFADLQQLRSGLRVLNTIVVNQLAVGLELSEENKTALDGSNNTTGIRLALTVTCGLKRSVEALWRLPTNGNPRRANLTLLRAVSDALFKTSCLWVGSLHRAQYPNSTLNFSCTSCEEMASICNSLGTLMFVESLESQFHTLQSTMLNQTHSDQWLKKNIDRNSILPEVYDIIHQ